MNIAAAGNVLRLAGLAVANTNALQVVFAKGRNNFRIRQKLYVLRRFNLIDQIPRHAVGEGIGADNNCDFFRILCEVNGSLTGRVSATHNKNVLVLAGNCLGQRRSVVNAQARQMLQAGNIQFPPCQAAGN